VDRGFLSGLAAGLVLVAGVGVVVSELAPPVAVPVAASVVAPEVAPATKPTSAPEPVPGVKPQTSLAPASGTKPAAAAIVTSQPVTQPAQQDADAARSTAAPASKTTPVAPVEKTAMRAVAGTEPAMEVSLAPTPAPAAGVTVSPALVADRAAGPEPGAPKAAMDAPASLAASPPKTGMPVADPAPVPPAGTTDQPATSPVSASLPQTRPAVENPAPKTRPGDAGTAAANPSAMAKPGADTLAGAVARETLPLPAIGAEPMALAADNTDKATGASAATEDRAQIGSATPTLAPPVADPAPAAEADPAPLQKAADIGEPITTGKVILSEGGTTGTGAAPPVADDLAPDTVLTTEPQPVQKPGILALTNGGMPGSASAPKPGFSANVPGVRVVRPESTAPGASEMTEPDGVTDDAAPALQRNAVACANTEGKPLFSVILIDDGNLDRAQITGIGFPVTVALDPTRADAATAQSTYRAAGLEVLILATTLPAGATASDLEVTFQSHFSSLPGAVGVLDLPLGGFQGNRIVAQQVVAILGEGGYGLVTIDKGLNPASQVAEREKVAQARVFRELDGTGENLPTMRRYLDRAAFRAAQESGVVVLGHARAETLQALVEWAAEGRAANMALCPVSAVMTGQ